MSDNFHPTLFPLGKGRVERVADHVLRAWSKGKGAQRGIALAVLREALGAWLGQRSPEDITRRLNEIDGQA